MNLKHFASRCSIVMMSQRTKSNHVPSECASITHNFYSWKYYEIFRYSGTNIKRLLRDSFGGSAQEFGHVRILQQNLR